MDEAAGRMQEVHIAPRPLERFEPVVGPEPVATLKGLAADLREQLAGHAILNLNSTAVGGGVAEMLRPLLAYTRGEGIDAR